MRILNGFFSALRAPWPALWRAAALGLVCVSASLSTPVAAAPIGYSVRSDADDNLYRIDLSTGVATLVGPSGFSKIEGMAMSPAGSLYAVDPQASSPQLLRCSTVPSSSALCAPVGATTLGIAPSTSPVGLAFLPNGELYLAVNATIYFVNPTTGAAVNRGSPGSIAIAGMAGTAPTPSCASGLFALSANANPASLYCVNTTTGALTSLGAVTPSSLDAGFDADRTTGLLWEITNGNPSQAFSIDPETRATSAPVVVTREGAPIGGFEGLAVEPSPAAVAALDPFSVPTHGASGAALLGLLIALLGLRSTRNARR
ncbi:MAG: hypothetical protein EAZ21_02445 [Betaproteobacteria bacterium]|nr:MAG: hypothetical protein EAZ21_02445 [Betaproteobacteria bacterium]